MTDFDSQKKHAPKGTEKQSDFFVMNRKSIKKGPFSLFLRVIFVFK
jgi:hypothetical protein